MVSSVALDEAIRTLSVEIANDKEAFSVGKEEAETKVLAHYAKKGRRRAALGALAGSSIMAGMWKFSKNQKKKLSYKLTITFLTVVCMLAGGLFGASYGVISIRRELFMDLLMLPSDQSPFATRARQILMTKIPNNTFVQELDKKFRNSMASNEWNDDVNSSERLGLSSLPRASHGSNNEIPSSIPPITGIDTPRPEKDHSNDAFGDSDDKAGSFPFFFGAKPSSEDAMNAEEDDTSFSRDTYAQKTRNAHRVEPGKNAAPLRHDEDDYFFGYGSETDAPAKPTTWEEIRRRAAERRK